MKYLLNIFLTFLTASEHNYSDSHRTSGSVLNHGSTNSALAYTNLYQTAAHLNHPYYDVMKSESSQESINSPHIVSLAPSNNNNNNNNNNINTNSKDRPSVLSMSVIS